MTTPIKPNRRHRLAPMIFAGGGAMVLAALVIWLVLAIWARGGPQPVHEIVIALPAPQIAPAGSALPTGPRA